MPRLTNKNYEAILERSPLASVRARLNKIQEKLKNKYKGQSRFPIGTYRPLSSYDLSKDIPESELHFFEMENVAPDNASSICCIGQSGTHKTTLIKNLVYYNSFLKNTKYMVLDLKETSSDWEKCNELHNNAGMLFPNDPDVLNIKTGCPEFAIRRFDASDRKKFKLKALNLAPVEFADMDMLVGLGFSGGSRRFMQKLFEKDLTVDQIADAIEMACSKNTIHAQSQQNVRSVFDQMVRTNFLTKKNYVDIDEIFDAGQGLAMGFNRQVKSYASVYVDKLLNKIHQRSGRKKTERYFIVVDDCQNAFGKDMTSDKYPSVETGIASLTQWRCIFSDNNIRLADGRLRNVEQIYRMFLKNEELKIINIDEIDKTKKTISKIKNMQVEYKKRLKYTIKTYRGNSIEVTDGHKLFKYDGDVKKYYKLALNKRKDKNKKVIECKVEDLKVGDGLLMNWSISGYEYTDDINCNYDFVIEKVDKWESNMIGNSKCYSNIVKKVTPELSRLTGYLIADGCFTSKTGIYFCDSNKSPLGNDFWYCVKKVFGNSVTKYVQTKNRGKSCRIFVSNKNIKRFFQYHCLDKNRKKRVPDFIMKASLINKREFIKAYADCDGIVNEGMVKISTISKNICNSLIALMTELGIYSSVNIEKRFNNKNYYANAKDIYNILCLGDVKLVKYREEIGTNIVWRKKIMEIYEIRTGSTNKDLEDLKFVRIKEISVLECDEPFYNIEIENNHNFFTGTIGSVLSSNSRGINMCFGIQSPSMLDVEIYNDIKHFFIYMCGNSESLTRFIYNPNIKKMVAGLDFRPQEHISQCLHIYPDKKTIIPFYPFNSQINN